jgi:hypothetical protein
MGRYAVGTRSAGAGSTTLAVGSVFAGANNEFKLVEVGAFNTTATACSIALRRWTALGTQGAGLTEIPYNPDISAATATGYDTHTVTGTITGGEFARASLGAAIGSGVIWTFDRGASIIIPKGTGNGIAIMVGTGTGQILDWYMIWDE